MKVVSQTVQPYGLKVFPSRLSYLVFDKFFDFSELSWGDVDEAHVFNRLWNPNGVEASLFRLQDTELKDVKPFT